jgi:hypothetical protein
MLYTYVSMFSLMCKSIVDAWLLSCLMYTLAFHYVSRCIFMLIYLNTHFCVLICDMWAIFSCCIISPLPPNVCVCVFFGKISPSSNKKIEKILEFFCSFGVNSNNFANLLVWICQNFDAEKKEKTNPPCHLFVHKFQGKYQYTLKIVVLNTNCIISNSQKKKSKLPDFYDNLVPVGSQEYRRILWFVFYFSNLVSM